MFIFLKDKKKISDIRSILVVANKKYYEKTENV